MRPPLHHSHSNDQQEEQVFSFSLGVNNSSKFGHSRSMKTATSSKAFSGILQYYDTAFLHWLLVSVVGTDCNPTHTFATKVKLYLAASQHIISGSDSFLIFSCGSSKRLAVASVWHASVTLSAIHFCCFDWLNNSSIVGIGEAFERLLRDAMVPVAVHEKWKSITMKLRMRLLSPQSVPPPPPPPL